MYKRKYIIFILITLSILLHACSSESDSETSAEEQAGIGRGGAPVTVASIGTIDGFGSIIINDVKYETDNAVFMIDDRLGTQVDLSIGQVILIDGIIESDGKTRIAENVSFYTNVLGPIDSVSPIESRLTILGQDVLIDNTTILSGIDNYGQLKAEQLIQVSGFVNSQQQIVASYIKLLKSSDDYQVIGQLSELDSTSYTFSIGTLTIDYSTAIIEGDLLKGANIKVNGELNAEGVLVASSATVIDQQIVSQQIVDIEGLITEYISASSFEVNGVRIATDDNTVVENGSLDDLSVDARIEVDGKTNAQGTVIADRIVIIHTGPVSFSGTVYTGEYVEHTFKSNELDKEMWITLNPDGHANLFVERLENGRYVQKCADWALTEYNQGRCYLANEGNATWRVRILGTWNDDIREELTTHYQLNIFFRRVEYVTTDTITASIPKRVYQNAGDRSLFHITTDNAPPGSFLAVTVEGLQNSGVIYIKGDAQPEAGSSPLFDCRLDNNTLRLNRHIRRTCWLNNDEVSNWYLSLESVANQQYTIYADFIVPTNLENGYAIDGAVSRVHGHLYALDVSGSDASVGVLVSELNDATELHIKKDQPPTFHIFDCAQGLLGSVNRQCIIENLGTGTWYALISGDIGLSYKIQAHAQQQAPAIRTLSLGESIEVDQAAATIMTYRVPKGSIDKAFFVGVLDYDDAVFELSVQEDLDIPNYARACYQNHPYRQLFEYRYCRLLNEGEGDYWYITVESAVAGRYRLWTTSQEIIDLNLNEPVSGMVSTDNLGEGILYRVQVPNEYKTFTASVTEKTAPAVVMASVNRPVKFREYMCSHFVRWRVDSSCSNTKNNEAGAWYIVVDADKGTEFMLNTKVE